MAVSAVSRIRVSVGGLCFDLRAKGLPLLQDFAEPYRQFVLAPGAADDGETVQVDIAAAPVEPARGRLLFDSGAWRIYAEGAERSLLFQPPTMPRPLYAARFQPGSRRVGIVCAPELVDSAAGVAGIRCLFGYPLDQVLTMYLLGDSGLILHAAGFILHGGAYALPGVSGAGKSTISRLAAGRSGVRILSDDRVILRVRNGQLVVHGTPWPGEAGIAQRRAAPAAGLLFLEKGVRNGVRATAPRETLARLLPTASLPWYDPESLEAGLRACDGIIRGVSAGVLTFRPEEGALEALERNSHFPAK